jgi:hypothetical protein
MPSQSILSWSGFNNLCALAPTDTVGNRAAFNPLSQRDFIASVLFKITGAAFPTLTSADPATKFLFGNFLASTGWMLELAPLVGGSGEMALSATVSANVPTQCLLAPIDPTEEPAVGNLMERLILATMHFRPDVVDANGTIDLYINGNRVVRGALTSAYVAAAAVPVVGRGDASDAAGIDIVGVAYSMLAAGAPARDAIPALMASHFKSCFETNSMALLQSSTVDSPSNVEDFAHRYNATSSAPGTQTGTLIQAPNAINDVFVYSGTGTLAKGPIRDDGNQGYNELPNVSAIPLALVTSDAGVSNVKLNSTLNPQWCTIGPSVFQEGEA